MDSEDISVAEGLKDELLEADENESELANLSETLNESKELDGGQDASAAVVEEEEDGQEGEELGQEEDQDILEGDEDVLEVGEDEDGEGEEMADIDLDPVEGEAEAEEAEVETSEVSKTVQDTPTEKTELEKKDDHDEEEDADETEEANKKMAKEFDPNLMPQVNVNILSQRRWQVKVYPLRPFDFMSGQIHRVFKQAKESLIYVYTSGNRGMYSNGKAELYMSTISQAVRVMQSLFKMEFYHPETNFKIIRKNDEGVVIERAFMRYDTKMTSMLCQPSGPVRRVGSKRERIIGSVFLKNLPDGATKDMLRVMFPFAAEINFNPEKFKDSTARLVLSNRNSVIPCLKAFSKVELGGNILELCPLEKRKKPDETQKKTSEDDKAKTDSKPSTPAKDKDNTSKTPAKKEEVKSSSASKDTPKKGPSGDAANNDQKDGRNKTGAANKKPEQKRSRGGNTPQGSNRDNQAKRSGYGNQGKFNQQQRWQGGLNSQRNRGGGFRQGAGTGGRMSGRGSSFSGNRNRFGSGDGGFRSGGSPGRMSGGLGMAQNVNPEMTKEMMHLQAQLSVAIKNQITMLNQTQLAVEQAKRGAAATTAAAAAAALGGGNLGAGFSRAGMAEIVQQDQFNRLSDQPRRNEAEPGSRTRIINRTKSRDRRDNFGNRGSGRNNRGPAESRNSGYGPKRSSARAGFDSESYDEMPYPKRSNYGAGSSGAQGSRSWAEESEDLDIYSNKQSLGYGGAGSFRGDTSDYGLDAGYDDAYDNRQLLSGSGRSFGSSEFGAAARNMNYNNTSGYDYGF